MICCELEKMSFQTLPTFFAIIEKCSILQNITFIRAVVAPFKIGFRVRFYLNIGGNYWFFSPSSYQKNVFDRCCIVFSKEWGSNQEWGCNYTDTVVHGEWFSVSSRKSDNSGGFLGCPAQILPAVNDNSDNILFSTWLRFQRVPCIATE